MTFDKIIEVLSAFFVKKGFRHTCYLHPVTFSFVWNKETYETEIYAVIEKRFFDHQDDEPLDYKPNIIKFNQHISQAEGSNYKVVTDWNNDGEYFLVEIIVNHLLDKEVDVAGIKFKFSEDGEENKMYYTFHEDHLRLHV